MTDTFLYSFGFVYFCNVFIDMNEYFYSFFAGETLSDNECRDKIQNCFVYFK